MDNVVSIISKHKNKKDLSYYLDVINIASDNVYSNPDMCIEACKSLIEGISKTIILELDRTARVEKIEELPLEKLYKNAVDIVDKYNDSFETNFAKRFSTIVQVIGEVRNKRGDISHGRPTPKNIESDSYLSKLVKDLTDSFLEYLLKHFYDIELELNDLKYDNLTHYNSYIDETLGNGFSIKNVSYSKLLFENDYALYKEKYYDEYLPNMKDVESINSIVEINKVGVSDDLVIEVVEVKPPIKLDKKYKTAALVFAEKENLNSEKFIKITDYYLKFRKPIEYHDIGKVILDNVKLKERKDYLLALQTKVNQFLNSLNQL